MPTKQENVIIYRCEYNEIGVFSLYFRCKEIPDQIEKLVSKFESWWNPLYDSGNYPNGIYDECTISGHTELLNRGYIFGTNDPELWFGEFTAEFIQKGMLKVLQVKEAWYFERTSQYVFKREDVIEESFIN